MTNISNDVESGRQVETLRPPKKTGHSETNSSADGDGRVMQNHTSLPADDEMNGLLFLLRKNKWLITSVAIAGTVASFTTSLLVPKKYRATTLVMSVSRHSGSMGLGAASSVLSNMGGLASLVGISGGMGSSKAQALATLQSAVVTRRYIDENNLLPILFSGKWNPRAKRWRSALPGKVPSLWEGNRYFNKHVRTVFEDPRTGLIRVAITWTNPKLAAQWANGIVATTNSFMRRQAIREADRDIAFLQSEANKASDVQLKAEIYRLMQQEIRDEMVARGERDYALKVIDPAFVPEKPYSPLPLIWAVTGLLCGAALGVGVGIAKENLSTKAR